MRTSHVRGDLLDNLRLLRALQDAVSESRRSPSRGNAHACRRESIAAADLPEAGAAVDMTGDKTDRSARVQQLLDYSTRKPNQKLAASSLPPTLTNQE